MRFVHQTTGARVIFGAGRRGEVQAELAELGSRPLAIWDAVAASVAADVCEAVTGDAVAAIDTVRQHVPLQDAEAARSLARESGADCVLALGGGSTVGLAKAVVLTERLPILAIPTTYAGSEMTPVWGLTEGGVKRTGRAPAVAPRTVVYDPELTRSLPSAVTAASGLNAFAHCVDALWAPSRTPLTEAMAERAIALLAAGLPGAVSEGEDLEARATTLAGAWMAGATFAIAGSSFHHKICHVLGGRFDLPHAETHAALLPGAVALGAERMPAAGAAIERALGGGEAAAAVAALSTELGAPTSLAPFGLTPERAKEVASEIEIEKLATPFELDHGDLRALLGGVAGPTEPGWGGGEVLR